nr:leukocyte immunoglobulin-like receptor subfamily A member 3 [Peromyscus maniculatus bairdii]
MTFTFTALLCLGALPKLILRAQPASVVSQYTTVIFLCEGTTGAKEYILYKEGYEILRSTEIPQSPRNKAEFSISKIDHNHAGRYSCQYRTRDGWWSEYSDSLELVVTGAYSKPSLSAKPSPVVTEGGTVTLQCVSGQRYHRFILTKEGLQKLSWTRNSQYNYSTGQFEALLSVGPVTSRQRWTFRCYSFHRNSPQVWSEPSDPLQLLVSGLSKKPSLLTHQGQILDPGKSLTLQCCSDINYDRFVLYKLGGADFTQHRVQWTQSGLSLANFTLGPVSSSTGGQYRCYGAHNLSSAWSASSDPLDILITGQLLFSPSLSVTPNSTVHSGDNVTVLCQSSDQVDTFILSKEGAAQQPQRLKSKSEAWNFQAEFSMSAVTSDLLGTYRCYGSQDSSPYLLTQASDPVELTVSGPIGTSTPPPSKSMPTADASVEDTQLEDGANLEIWHSGYAVENWPEIPRGTGRHCLSLTTSLLQRPAEEDPQGETYAQVKGSRLRRAGAVLPSVMSGEVLDTKDGQAEDDREMDSQSGPLLGSPGALPLVSWCAPPTVRLAADAQAARPRLELPKRWRCEAVQPPTRHDCGSPLSAGPRSPRAGAPGPVSGNGRMWRAARQLAPRPGAAEPRALLVRNTTVKKPCTAAHKCCPHLHPCVVKFLKKKGGHTNNLCPKKVK